MASTTPTIIAGRYELQRRLATGGMAEVWLAMDLTLDRKVAVKWLKPTLATDEIVAERFRREAIAAASLNHPNIVAVHDVFEQDGRQAVVMQLVDGKSLRQLLDTQKRLSPELTCHIGIAVALALVLRRRLTKSLSLMRSDAPHSLRLFACSPSCTPTRSRRTDTPHERP